MLNWFKKVKNWLQGEEIIEIEEVILEDPIDHKEIQKLKHSKQMNQHLIKEMHS